MLSQFEYYFMKFPKEIKVFVESVEWTFAKTMPKWPHEYIVRRNVSEEAFLTLVSFIRNHGFEAPYYDKTYIYFEDVGMVYWTMGAPLEETIIVNRCEKSNTYVERLKKGTLP